METTIDVENTITIRDKKKYMDPYEASNELVMVGLLTETGEERRVFFNHNEREATPHGHAIVQQRLDKTTLLIGHNLQHDLPWLWESGFKYDGLVYDTMIAAYLLLRGQKAPLNLKACGERFNLTTLKQDTMDEYFSNGTSVADIPADELDEYLSYDLHTTQELRNVLDVEYMKDENKALTSVLDLTNETSKCLSKMNMIGVKVDPDVLEEVRVEFQTELDAITKSLNTQIKSLMGDMPVNLNSPEQMSQVIYGRKPIDKKVWADINDPDLKKEEWDITIDNYTEVVHKKRMEQCPKCKGSGQTFKTKVDGSLYKRSNKCVNCEGKGYILFDTKAKAGLRFRAPNAKWMKADGFSTGKDDLLVLHSASKDKGMVEAEKFLSNLMRLNAVTSYLGTYVKGIEAGTRSDGLLHVNLTQTITSTGRFSGRQPNMQNMPRGNTFPVKRVFISRWEGGKIMEADFAQLEFRAAAFLSGDPIAIEEVENGFDVHSYTAKVITDAGEPTTRQAAKEHTFAPLYGATGYGRTKAVAAYYTHFIDKYKGIAKWHKRLGDEAINTGKIQTPSGREFAFPDVTRRANGSVTYFTNIKNYPVQSFATADIVPAVLLEVHKRLEPYHSCIVNSVHDSVVIDIHPDEVQIVLDIIKEVNYIIKDVVQSKLHVDMDVPLLLESKLGNNWLEQEDVVDAA